MTHPGSTDARTPAGIGERLDRLDQFIAAAAPHLPAELLTPARSLLDRAGSRLRLGTAEGGVPHTVVALAGSTGSGKSSLFNRLARMELSPSGHLRPTTGEAHACAWGSGSATPLLDWLGVDPRYRFTRESVLDAEDEATLRGLVLLDLPDMDSVATSHRVEADRLVGLVDLLVWVLDPQKYADQAVHEQYLRHMGPLREVTVVVLNQVDRLTGGDADRCRADLARLVEGDGLGGVAVIATSALTGGGLDELRTLLEKTVAARQAALARWEGELDSITAQLAPLVAVQPPDDDAGPTGATGGEAVRSLVDALAAAAGVGAVVAATGEAYRRRAAVPGPPFRRRRSSVRADRGLARPGPAQPAAVAQAVNRFAEQSSAGRSGAGQSGAGQSGAGLPPPWPEAVQAAARSTVDYLPDDLGRAVAAARPRVRRGPGWALIRLLWWLGVLAALVGVAWLILDRAGWSGLERLRVPAVAELPAPFGLDLPVVVAGGGAALAVLLPLLAWPVRRWRVPRVRAAAEGRLRGAVAVLASERVVSPVRATLRDYHDARAALLPANPPPPPRRS